MFRELGFTVEKIGETCPDPVERRNGTAAEVSLIVADDFDMLWLDLAGQEFVKAERNHVPCLAADSVVDRRRLLCRLNSWWEPDRLPCLIGIREENGHG